MLTLRYQQHKGQDGSPLYPTDEDLGEVISNELTLGFWCSLFGKSFEELWRQCLRHAFPQVGRGLTRKEVSRRLTKSDGYETVSRITSRLLGTTCSITTIQSSS